MVQQPFSSCKRAHTRAESAPIQVANEKYMQTCRDLKSCSARVCIDSSLKVAAWMCIDSAGVWAPWWATLLFDFPLLFISWNFFFSYFFSSLAFKIVFSYHDFYCFEHASIRCIPIMVPEYLRPILNILCPA